MDQAAADLELVSDVHQQVLEQTVNQIQKADAHQLVNTAARKVNHHQSLAQKVKTSTKTIFLSATP
ncbi:MAG: hypothetical protein Q4B28_02155 [bacterium]|nr:hypothetical protein [bacterium]